MLNSKAETLRTCWTLRTGDGNKIFEDESSVRLDLQGRDIKIVIYEDETLTC